MNSRDIGQAGEYSAEQFLTREGLKLIQRNYSAKTGEIDLVMSDKDQLVFVEVRLRNNSGYGTGAESVTKRKQRKIINTAHRYLQEHGTSQWQSFRFDVISIGESIDWIPGAFTLD